MWTKGARTVLWGALMLGSCARDSDDGGGTGGAHAEDAGSAGPTCAPAFGGMSIRIDSGIDYLGPAIAVVPGGGAAPGLRLPTGEEIRLSAESQGHGLVDGEAVTVAARVQSVNDGALTLARVAVRDAATGALRFAVYHDFVDEAAWGGPWATELPGPEVFGFTLAIDAQSTCFEPAGSCWTEGTETQRLRVTFREGDRDDQAVAVDDGGVGHFLSGETEYEAHVATARHWPPDRSECTDGVESGAWLAFDVRLNH